MKKSEIFQIIEKGENIHTEFKLEDVNNERLIKEICGFCNSDGGILILGVDDFGQIIGCSRNDNEERIMNMISDNLEPKFIPEYLESIIDNKKICIVKIGKKPDKPYSVKKKNANKYYIRRGTTCREADRNELLRLFQKSALLHYEILERKDSTINQIDFSKFQEYLKRIYVNISKEDAIKVMTNKKFLSKNKIPTIAGLVLFGNDFCNELPSILKVDIVKFSGIESDYNIINQRSFYGSLLNLYDENGNISQLGLIDKCIDYIKINIKSKSQLNQARREMDFEYPIETIRELLVNCFAHRDYTIEGEGIRIFIYDDRMEFISPGGLPNTIDIEDLTNSFKYGVVPTYARNPIIVDVLKIFGYIENIGMGLYKKVFKLLKKFNNTIPVLEDTGRLFVVKIFS